MTADSEGLALVEFEGYLGLQYVYLTDLEPDTSAEPMKKLTPEQRRVVEAMTEAMGRAFEISERTGTVPEVNVDQVAGAVKQPIN